MADDDTGQGDAGGSDGFGRSVSGKEARKVKARKSPPRSIWFSLGMMGLVGWSVSVPALVGVAVGVWIDRTWPGRASWTLTGLVVGAALGCLSAWHWVKRESRPR